MKKPQYPLLQVLQVKQKRVEDAEKVVIEKIRLVEIEEKKLKECEEARDKAVVFYNDKLAQMRQALDEGEKPAKLRQMRDFLKSVKEKRDQEEIKVKEQKKMVDQAQANLDIARKELMEKRKDVEKIEMHQTEWEKEVDKEQLRVESNEMDELGSAAFIKQKKEKKKPFS